MVVTWEIINFQYHSIFMIKNIYFSASYKIFSVLTIIVTFQLVSTMKMNSFLKYSFFKIFFKLINLFLAALGFHCCTGLFLVVASRGCSSLRCTGLSLQWLLLLQSTGSRRAAFSIFGTRVRQLWLALFITVRRPLTLHRGARASHYRGLSCCGAQAPDSQFQQLWLTGLVAPWHVGSSRTRARTRVPCIGRRILNHCTTREAP